MTLLSAFVVRSSIVLLAGLVAAALLRRQPASLRHSIIAAALTLAAAQPALNRAMPAWVLPSIPWATESASAQPAVSVETEFVIAEASPVANVVKARAWARIVVAVWIAGTMISVALLLLGMAWLAWLQSRSRPAGAEWQDAETFALAQLGGYRRARIFISSHPVMIVTWGVLKPAILLPRDADAWSADRKRLVIAHEMAHLLRRDWLMQVVAEIARAINWFNPLFWVACAQLRRECEHACDDLVLDTGITATSYASHLVELARSVNVHGRTWMPAPSIARPSTLERRVRAMLNPHLDRRPVSMLHRSLATLVLIVIAIPIAIAAQALSTTSGRVTDPSGLPLPDAAVRLQSVTGDASFEARTDASGSFQVADVPAGDYWLSARYPGFSTQRSRIHLNGPATLSLQLQVGNLRETITVSSGAGDVNRVVTASKSPSVPACGNTVVGGNLKPPMKLKDVRPRFKQAWVEGNQEGSVLLQALIGADGRVKNVEVLSPSQADMEEEAIAAVAQWEFSPTYLNCQAVDVKMYVTVSFKIDR